MRFSNLGKRIVAALVAAIVFYTPGQLLAASDFDFTQAVESDEPTAMQLVGISRAGDRLVAVGERGLVIVSDDEGETWRQSDVPVSTTLTAVSFPSPELGWAVGHAGTILHSADGGDSWSLQFDGNAGNKQYLEYTRAQVAELEQVVEALAADAEGDMSARDDAEYALEDAIFAVEDAEAAIETGPADPFLDVLFTSTTHGIAVGAYGMIYRTENGGQDWQLSASGIENIERFHYYSLAEDDAGQLYLSGEAGLLYHSADGGLNWQRVWDLYEGSLFGITAQSGSVYAYGLRGNVFRSDDQGATWASVQHDVTYSFYGGVPLGDSGILMVGAGGVLLQGDVSGGALQGSNHASRVTFSSVVEGRNGGLIVVGMNGVTLIDGVDR